MPKVGRGGPFQGRRFKVFKAQRITKNLLSGPKKIRKFSRSVLEQWIGKGRAKSPPRTFFKIPSVWKPAHKVLQGNSPGVLRISFSQLDQFNQGFPSGFGIDDQKIQNYYLNQARHWVPQITSPEEAFTLWDHVVRQFGYPGLEEYVLFHQGYLAATFLPAPYRRHIISGEDQFLGVSTHRGFAERKWDIKEKALAHIMGSQYPPELALRIAEYEWDFPEWRGLLKPEYFDRTPGGNYPLAPPPAIAWSLWKLALHANRTIFPQEISELVSGSLRFESMQKFFSEYRHAERWILDGGKEDVHCGFSSYLVCNLMQTWGFPSFPVNVFRVLMAEKEFFKYGFYMDRLARHLGTSPAGARLAILEWEPGGLTDEVLHEQSMRFETSPKNIQGAFRFFQNLQKEDRERLRGKAGRGHTVAAFRNQNEFYLMDINGQQFGSEFDRLALVPGEEASENGFLLFAPLEGIWRSRSFSDRVKPLSAYFRASQKIVRLYWGLISRIPKPEERPASVEITWPPKD